MEFVSTATREARLREALAGGPDPGLQAELARAVGQQGRFAEAHALLDRVDDPMLECLERGRVLRAEGRPAEAAPFFQRVWDEGPEDLAVDAGHMLAIVRPEEAPQWNARALARAEAAGLRPWVASLCHNQGQVLQDRGDFDAALAHLERAEAEQEDPRRIRMARWCVARCLRLMGRVEEALAKQRALVEDLAGLHEGYVCEEIGECLLALGRPEEAAEPFGRAYRALLPYRELRADRAEFEERLERLRRRSA